MSSHYQAVNWNRFKQTYDLILISAVLLCLGSFGLATFALYPDATAETVLIRGLGLTALLLLHIVLCIGPLCRLDRRFLPLLYNRRHLGVAMFLLALGHGTFAVIQFHAGGDLNPLVSLLVSDGQIGRLSAFPFEWLGLAAVVILFFMAATSHDFWLAYLTPPVWKALHMLVYVAYGLLIAHVALGILQAERSPAFEAALGLGVMIVLGLHLAAAFRERHAEAESPKAPSGWSDVCAVDEIKEGRARIATVAGERIAVFRHEGKISCVSNVCRHQNGPLGEGRIVDGCITCPWHGYQYRPDNGQSPPPFTEKIPTFNARVVQGRVFVDPIPNPPGTFVKPVVIASGNRASEGRK
ncbi:MAG: Rieske 2Fe-2S domain-containing protein [Gemmatimonadota bacterium]